MKLPVYLDYAATTPVDPRVAKAMSQCLTLDGNFGNPSSRSHIYGWKAEEAVENARGDLADLIEADPREIVWTSGATEANNLALKGVAATLKRKQRGVHIVTSKIEHKSVLDTCAHLEKKGFQVSYVTPGQNAGKNQGIVGVDEIAAAVREDTSIVSLMHVNNELGVINKIAEVGEFCRSRNILFHVDAAQSLGKIPLDVNELKVDLLSMSAHKMYGPKGIGALYVRRSTDVRLQAQMHGGGHERGMRSGTLPTHQIVGFGEAAKIAQKELAAEAARIRQLRQRFIDGLAWLPLINFNGDQEHCVPGLINFSVAGVEGETLLLALKDLAISTGSACTSLSVEPSYVLRALGIADELAHASLRISMGRFTSEEEVVFAAEKICSAVNRLRESASAP